MNIHLNNNIKRGILFIIIISIIFVGVAGIMIKLTKRKNNKGGKIQVIATLYPQYDFVKHVGGDKVNVTLILPPGTESHTYEPTPKDIIQINKSKLFIYTGKEMEPWAEKLISGMKSSVNVLDLSTTVKLINSEEFEEEYEKNNGTNGMVESNENTNANEQENSQNNSNNEHENNNEYSNENDGDNHNSEQNEENNENEHNDEHENQHDHNHEHSEEEHHHEYDPHIWLNPQYAIKMVESIKEELCRIDPKNSEYYTNNANAYIQEIQALDADFENAVNVSSTKKIAFGGAFAYAYFVERYNLEFITAYQACGENVEPSTVQIKNVIDYINNNQLPVIFYKEYTNGNIARTISECTNAKMLVFNTVHNVSKDEIKNGATYVSIMRENLNNLKIALGVE